LYRKYVERGGQTPVLFLYDVTSSYLEGEKNELADYGHNRDGKRGKKQIVIGLMTDAEGEPVSVRVFEGNTADPVTVPDQIEIIKKKFQVQEVVFVGDRGMIKAKGKEKLSEQGMRYITALTDPQIRKLLKRGVIQLGLFEEKVCEVEADGRRYILRKNELEARKVAHRLQDKLKKLNEKVSARNEKVATRTRCKVEAGVREVKAWIERYRLSGFVTVVAEGKTITVQVDPEGQRQAMELAGCYLIETDVPKQLMDAQTAHDRYKDLAKVERDIRTLKTGLLEVRPIFVRKEKRTRGHVFVCMLALKVSRELERRLQAVFKTTDTDPYAVTLKDALEALGRICLQTYQIDETTPLTQVPQPDADQRKILEALKIPVWN
jgi:transposase